MSWTRDRTIQDNRLLLFIVLGIAVVVVAAAGFYLWSRRPAADGMQHQAAQNGSSVILPAFRTEPLTITFFYPLEGMLASAPAPAKRQPDTQAQAGEALAAVFSDPRAAQAEVIRDLKLKSFFLDERGTAYVALATDRPQGIQASAWDEELAIYAMVNTLMQNFEDVKQVVFLMDGREASTLAGHMDLARRYTKRMDLVKQ